MGLFMAMFGITTVIGPLIGGVMVCVDYLSWRWIFYINLPHRGGGPGRDDGRLARLAQPGAPGHRLSRRTRLSEPGKATVVTARATAPMGRLM